MKNNNMPARGWSAPGGKKIVFLTMLLFLLAAGCQEVTLKRDVPYSPPESYQPLPK